MSLLSLILTGLLNAGNKRAVKYDPKAAPVVPPVKATPAPVVPPVKPTPSPVATTLTPMATVTPTPSKGNPAPSAKPVTDTRAGKPGPTIAVINHSSVITDTEVSHVMMAVQIQIDRDFAPIWDQPANLVFLPKTAAVPADYWQVILLDDSDQSGALGYHETTATFQPLGKVFVKTDVKYGLKWSVTLSHEVLEMIGDPYINTTVFIQQTATTGTLVAFEMCDAVEDDKLGYAINGVQVSDFVTPAFYQSGQHPVGTKFDFAGHLTAPMSIATNGYLSVFPVTPTTRGWTQMTGAEGIGPRLAAKKYSLHARGQKRGKLSD